MVSLIRRGIFSLIRIGFRFAEDVELTWTVVEKSEEYGLQKIPRLDDLKNEGSLSFVQKYV